MSSQADPRTRAWLLDTDPALRWQVERDLLAEPEEVWRATRARVATEGYGARLLALQDEDGQWAGGAFFPRGWQEPEERVGQPWTATTWSLTALREWGLDPAALGDTAERLARHSRWEYDDLPYWGGEVDCCINAATLANGTWLGADVAGLEQWFADHQMTDGGWNCAWEWDGSTVSSFHSTLNSLEGLLHREQHGPGGGQLRELRRGGEEYLLERRLMHRRTSGELVGPWVTELGYPFRSVYNVLHALDYLRRSSLLDGRPPDPRAAEAVEVLRAKRSPDGTWTQEVRHAGEVWFEVDVPVGEPSPWLTLYGTRVLDWWDSSTG
ncbi:squalene cyclase [Ornithinimicrobium cerasi]|uniref:Squalene cyclase n=1 Tax=Ornithinimicrobium cerasi TaxID=2248773 RepID=A0A285VM58_9MICO|nr:squalene cyclase [Ornithinimicrobium cerasi]SOC55043.1 hypothetical protein SAMN05421879_104125 [Ornithinimicrobium cerasi]